MRRMSRTKWVPLKIVYGADISAGTPFLSFTEYLRSVSPRTRMQPQVSSIRSKGEWKT